MKEASGEASNTVITIILIAAILAAATLIITMVSRSINNEADKLGNSGAETNRTITEGLG